MFKRLPLLATLTSVAFAAMFAASAVHAQKIICWKDKAGKIIGCGDRVPQEFQNNESNRLDKRGITRETNASAAEAARLREEEKKNAAIKAEEDQRLAEQQRQDTALVNTYASTKEIDVRRDRELQVVDLQIQQLQASLKSSADAHANQIARHAAFEKRGKVPDNVKDDLERAAEEKNRVTERIADREKDKERIRASYLKQKARYLELKGLPAENPAPATTRTGATK